MLYFSRETVTNRPFPVSRLPAEAVRIKGLAGLSRRT